MDIRLLLRVIARFRYLAIFGVLLAGAAMVFSVARLDRSTWQLSYRQKLQYRSTAVLLVDGNRPSWLYAVPPGSTAAGASQDTTTTTTEGSDASGGPIADPARLGGLTSLYGYFVQSDAVRRLTGDDAINSVGAETITADVGNGRREPLPLLAITATAGSRTGAVDLARRVTEAFRRYVLERQTRAQVSDDERVTLRVVNAPSPATLVAPRSYTRAVVAGLMVIVATIGLMLVIENLRPGSAARDAEGGVVPPPPPPPPVPARERRPERRAGPARLPTAATMSADPVLPPAARRAPEASPP
jgi:hypothetical protein